MNSPAPESSGQSSGKRLVLLLLAAVAGLGAWAFLLKRDLATVNEALAASQKASNAAVASSGEVQRLKLKVAELEARLAAVPPTAASPAAPKSAPVTPGAAIGSLASQVLANPAMRSLVATQMRRTNETRFAELFARFGFDEAQRGRFLDVLMEDQEALMDLSQKLTAGNLSPDERLEIGRQGRDLEAAVDGRMREFLGDENKFAEYKLFTDQQTERTQVTALQTALNRTAQPLTTEQSAALTDIMYQERKSLAASNPSPTADSSDPAAALSNSAVDQQIRRQETVQARVADRAASILSPDQMTVLRTTQENQLRSLRAGAEMARQMLGAPQKQ